MNTSSSFLSIPNVPAFSLPGSFSVTATSTSKDVLEALAAARKKGKPYSLSFSTAGTSKQQEEGGGSNEARNCGEAEPQTGNEPRDQEGGEGEALREDKSSRAGLAVGSDEPEAGADGGMGEEGGGKDGGGRREGVEGAEGGGGPAAEGLQEEEPEAGSGDGEVTLMYEMYDEKFPIKVTEGMLHVVDARCRSSGVFFLEETMPSGNTCTHVDCTKEPQGQASAYRCHRG